VLIKLVQRYDQVINDEKTKKRAAIYGSSPKSGFYNSNCKVVVDDANIQKNLERAIFSA
jgi:hypothetical protein